MKPDERNEANRDWPQPNQFRKSIRVEFSVYVSVMILLLMAVTGYVITDKFVNETTRHVIETLLVQARSYSGPAGKHIISANGPDALMLNNICKKLIDDNPDIKWVGITGKDMSYLAHTDIKNVVTGKKMIPVKTRTHKEILRPGEAFAVEENTLLVTIPIKENDLILGYLGIASTDDKITAARQASIFSVVSITVIMLLIGLPLTMLIVNRKLQPVSVITDNLKSIDYENIEVNIPLKSSNEFGYLAETLRVMGIKLNSAQQEKIEKERITREFEIAHELQANILPKSFPCESVFNFSGYYASAKEVGGDYYDFLDIGADKIGFLVADVSGKSLPGMLVMLMTRDIVRHSATIFTRPDQILSRVNEELLKSIKKGMFVTMFIGILDKNTGQFSFASAGHNPLIHYNSEKNIVELIKTKGFPLGMMPPVHFDKRIEVGEIDLGSKDWLIQYSDGINEAQNETKEEFGMDRFVDIVKNYNQQTSEELIETIIANHSSFVGSAEQYDDITLLAMKWNGQQIIKSSEENGVLVSGN
ncbi:MAG: SpoIIE family protein phosphatase [candidate division Zixibacteria bacterium]|nr:SpoIIE family protein phosphatase [candidate division Zixibacteria bacterium]